MVIYLVANTCLLSKTIFCCQLTFILNSFPFYFLIKNLNLLFLKYTSNEPQRCNLKQQTTFQNMLIFSFTERCHQITFFLTGMIELQSSEHHTTVSNHKFCAKMILLTKIVNSDKSQCCAEKILLTKLV